MLARLVCCGWHVLVLARNTLAPQPPSGPEAAVQVRALQEENRALRTDNSTLATEMEQMNRVASYVGSRVARVLAGARRANNYNAALVGELKRWNRKLEVEPFAKPHL
jgi:hypothetical protein